jgi:hypothetical protein
MLVVGHVVFVYVGINDGIESPAVGKKPLCTSSHVKQLAEIVVLNGFVIDSFFEIIKGQGN